MERIHDQRQSEAPERILNHRFRPTKATAASSGDGGTSLMLRGLATTFTEHEDGFHARGCDAIGAVRPRLDMVGVAY